MMIDLFSALFGGVLVGGGMYVGAQIANVLAPRTPREPRAPRIQREPRSTIAHSSASRERRQAIPIIPGMPSDAAHVRTGNADTDATKALGNDVVKALTTSGYAKAEAAMAVAACSGSERSTIEAWLRAALKKLNMRGAIA
jgi:hypothetical protein